MMIGTIANGRGKLYGGVSRNPNDSASAKSAFLRSLFFLSHTRSAAVIHRLDGVTAAFHRLCDRPHCYHTFSYIPELAASNLLLTDKASNESKSYLEAVLLLFTEAPIQANAELSNPCSMKGPPLSWSPLS